MYRVNDITDSWKTLVGFMQHYDTSEFTIADSLTVSDFGKYFQEIHPLMTLDNLKSIAPNFNAITYQTWTSVIQFRVGDKTTNNSKHYRAKLANIDKVPETNPTYWERFDPFSEWLEQKRNASIKKVMSRIWTDKLAAKTARNILENKTLFNGAGRIADVTLNTDSLAGIEIIPARAYGVVLKSAKIGLQFTGTGTYILYLMHTSCEFPIQVISLEKTVENGMEWFDVDLSLPYLSDDTGAGGSWYLVYDQTELPDGSQAINRNIDWSKKPCSSCDASTYSGWQIWSQYLEIHPFKVAGTSIERMDEGDFSDDFDSSFYTTPIKIWDIAKNLYTYSNNYGINLQITIECDPSDSFIEQREIFSDVIGLQFASDMMREMVYNPAFRIGRTQQNFNRNEILYELDGDSQSYKKSGINYKLDKAYEAIDVDTSKMSRICFPCKNRGLKYRSV